MGRNSNHLHCASLRAPVSRPRHPSRLAIEAQGRFYQLKLMPFPYRVVFLQNKVLAEAAAMSESIG
jgi:hypothetical protein